MKTKLITALLCLSSLAFAKDYLDNYNVAWDSQSKNSFESMPLGGGDVGLNVWVEDDELLFYIGQSGTFDENNQMLKHGRIRLSMSPNPFTEASEFSQELHLREGSMSITAKNAQNEVEINLWVEVFNPVVHIETECKKPTKIKAAYETWRMEDLVVPQGMRHASFSLTSYPGEVVTYKDSVQFTENGVRWFHRNRADKLLYDMMVEQQDLLPVKDKIPNTQINRTFGGELCGEGFRPAGMSEGKYISTDFTAWQLESESSKKMQNLTVTLSTGQFETLTAWEASLRQAKEAESDITATQEWWNQFWERSYIISNETSTPEDSVWQAGRNYQLFRYMLGCNAMGEYPTKFNGSLFTVDPVFTREKYDWTPDFRCWGGGSFTAQNQRLVYWPMLKSGDFDMMPPQFNYYKRILSAAEARTARYWGHEGACFTEQLENFGLPFAGGWGFESGGRKRDPKTEYGVQTNPFVSHHYVNQLEFSLMILDYYAFSGNDISEYMPFIKSSLRFFDEHYQYRARRRTGEALSDDGKLIIFPSTVAESYKNAMNPTDVISALKALLPRMQSLPSDYVSDEEKIGFAQYLERVPDIALGEREGHQVILPAESWGRVGNAEFPELYSLFPYSLYGLHTSKDKDLMLSTWYYGYSETRKKVLKSWSQIPIFAARLGLSDEVAPMIKWKLGNGSCRFPAFWGPGFDWVPDMNHGGSAAIALQEMLMQTLDDKIYLLPAWPRDWDVKFRLHAPRHTVVEVEYVDGKLKTLNVFPHERLADVVIPLGE